MNSYRSLDLGKPSPLTKFLAPFALNQPRSELNDTSDFTKNAKTVQLRYRSQRRFNIRVSAKQIHLFRIFHVALFDVIRWTIRIETRLAANVI